MDVLVTLIFSILAIIILVLAVIYFYATKNYRYWTDRGVPNLKPTFPYGNFGELIKQKIALVEYYEKLYKAFKGCPIAGYISVMEPVLLVRDPEIVKQMLVKDFDNFHDRGVYFDEEKDPLVAHLFNLTGQRWHQLRQKISPTFTSGKMRYMFPLIKACAEEFQKTVMREIEENGNEIEVKDLNARYTTDIIGSSAFGIDAGSLAEPEAEMRVIGRKIFPGETKDGIKNFIFFLSPKLSKFFKVKLVDPFVEESLIKIVSDTMEYREKNKIERNDFLQLLIRMKNDGRNDEVKNDGDVELNLNQLCAQCFVFFVGGFETSATTMTFTLYELAKNPSLQKDVADEVNRVLEAHNGVMTYESLADMNLLDMVIAEALRLYPPVPILFRECTRDYTIKGSDFPNLLSKGHSGDLLVEKGMKVIFPTCAMHRDPELFPDPERFDPQRFTEEAKAARSAFAYLPFGEGPRFCIGMRFGKMQTKAGIASLISKFELRLGSKSSGKLILDPASFVPTVKGGMFISFFPRKN
ncbi:hypothetical protein J437_LFUL015673 [Ladona fulva]|uniref:Cytochrome P450 n=1 Tax=Ladona fulva TaxID=123851 RepID=A0A8K0P3Y8_LADFU|nr:hypothetical protein J437_LFUL015673 [Ladona fulva]